MLVKNNNNVPGAALLALIFMKMEQIFCEEEHTKELECITAFGQKILLVYFNILRLL